VIVKIIKQGILFAVVGSVVPLACLGIAGLWGYYFVKQKVAKKEENLPEGSLFYDPRW
jgi:hypothetical protein